MTLPPMDFTDAFQAGLGRALVHLSEHADDPRLRDAVIHGLLHDQAYDSQCEPPRTAYLLEACARLSPPLDAASLLIPKLTHARNATTRGWNAQQWVNILVALGQQGDERAARAIREKYRRAAQTETPLWDLLGPALVQLDGLNGLRQIVRDQHRFTAISPDARHHPYVWRARTLLGDDVVDAELRHLPEALRPNRKRRKKETKKPAPTDPYQHVQMIIQEALQPRLHPVFMLPYQLIQRLTPPDWQRLTTDLDTEDLAKLRLLLSLFMRHGVPDALERLLRLVRHNDHEVAFRALRALDHLQDERVREFALELLRTPQRFSEEATSLLRLNYRPGDEQPIRSRLAALPGRQHSTDRHNLLFDLPDMAEASPDDGLLTLLADAFHQQPCSACRRRMLAVLIEHDAAPPHLLAEARLDASPEVRALAVAAVGEADSSR
ncbi:hypothetical protein [Deinococcus sp. JMULE3]|uniref:hypothetical protein n=1 Tax=Deinococcus sp. JMULE3 TaxID=2518341 RepID=UPI00157506FD|nr:hypothetical protein [Deinococcus sp. JMULE3]NTY01504.1 hypothetical protein [Deinococcus sp. JMULE3]